MKKFLCGQAQDIPIDDCHSIQPPVFRMPLDQHVDLFDVLDRASYQKAGKIHYGRWFFVILKKRHGDLVNAVARNVPLE